MITLVSKGNGKNYYGFLNDEILEIVKIKGAFYRTAYKDFKLLPVGDAIPKSHFILVN
jgi:hypothetical protein